MWSPQWAAGQFYADRGRIFTDVSNRSEQEVVGWYRAHPAPGEEKFPDIRACPVVSDDAAAQPVQVPGREQGEVLLVGIGQHVLLEYPGVLAIQRRQIPPVVDDGQAVDISSVPLDRAGRRLWVPTTLS